MCVRGASDRARGASALAIWGERKRNATVLKFGGWGACSLTPLTPTSTTYTSIDNDDLAKGPKTSTASEATRAPSCSHKDRAPAQRAIARKHSAQVARQHSAQVARQHGVQVARQHGVQVARQHGVQVARQHSVQVARQHGVQVARQHSAQIARTDTSV